MTPAIVIITIVAYFGLLTVVSLAASRSKSRGASFFATSRRVPWPVVAFAMLGASISGVTFISVPGMVVNSGYSYLQMVLGFIVGYALIAWVLVPIFYRLGLTSIYQWLEHRFGVLTYRSGAWLFFVSKISGAAIRFLVVCAVLQLMVFSPLGIPFEVNVLLTVAMIWLYTSLGGVTSVIWTDVLKSFCLVASVVLCIIFVAANMEMGVSDILTTVRTHHTARIFFLDNPLDASYFWKQFLAGIFMAIATNGLDQDMMQRNLACRDSSSARKNMLLSAVMQFFVIGLFLILGTLLVVYVGHTPSLSMPEKTDELFSLVASHSSMPIFVGILFVVGLIAAAYSAAGSALTALTTSFTIDILNRPKGHDHSRVHIAMSLLMALIIIIFYRLSSQDAISAVYTLASYTYGPILGLFAFGLITRAGIRDRFVPWVCVLAPLASWVVQLLLHSFTSYRMGFELLLVNAALTMGGLYVIIHRKSSQRQCLRT